jgi:hypothetical protein
VIVDVVTIVGRATVIGGDSDAIVVGGVVAKVSSGVQHV